MTKQFFVIRYGSIFFREGPNAHWTERLSEATTYPTSDAAKQTIDTWALSPACSVESHFDEVAFANECIGKTFGSVVTVVAVNADRTVHLEVQEQDGNRRLAVIDIDELYSIISSGLFTPLRDHRVH